MIFWLFFIGFILILVGPWKIGLEDNNTRFFLASAVIIIVAIIRFDVGYDYIAYYPLILNREYGFEPLSNFICKIFEGFNYPPLAIGCFSLISLLLISDTVYRFSSNKLFSLLIYVTFFYLTSLTTIRQGLAVAITFWGYRYLVKSKLWRYIVVCVVAIFVHKSAFIAVPIYFLYRYGSIKKSFLLLIIMGISVSIIMVRLQSLGFYGSAANRIANGGGSDNGRIIKFILVGLVIVSILFYIYRKSLLSNKLIALVIIGTSFPFLIGSTYGVRISEYYTIYYTLLLPNLLKRSGFICKFLMSLTFVLYFSSLVLIGTQQKRSPFTPYRTIFSLNDVKKPGLRPQ